MLNYNNQKKKKKKKTITTNTEIHMFTEASSMSDDEAIYTDSSLRVIGLTRLLFSSTVVGR